MVASTLNPAETVIRLAKVPHRYGVCRRTVTDWVDRGLEAWYLGAAPVTTLEAISRFAIPIEPAETTHAVRQSSHAKKQADDAREYFGVK